MQKYLTEKNTSKIIEFLSVALVIFIGYLLFLNNSYGLNYYNNGDMQRGFQRAISVLNNVNPYLEFNPNLMLEQEKVPGFFPLYFYFLAIIAKVSNYSFVLFIDNLRLVVFTAYISTGLIIYSLLRKQNKLLALFGMCVFMFNRWTLNDVFDLKQDTYVVVLTLISLINFEKNKRISYLFFGIATGLKHLTVLISPIFILDIFYQLINIYKNRGTKEVKKLVIEFFILSLFLIGPALISSIPFLIKTPENMTNSLLYNVTRTPESGLKLNTGFDRMLVLYNQDRFNNKIFYMLPRIPLVVALLLITGLFFLKKVNIWRYCAFTYLIFIGFNPVLYPQYYTWFMAFIPFVLLKTELLPTKDTVTKD